MKGGPVSTNNAKMAVFLQSFFERLLKVETKLVLPFVHSFCCRGRHPKIAYSALRTE